MYINRKQVEQPDPLVRSRKMCGGRRSPFIRACFIRTWSNSFKLREGRFRLDIRKKFFTTVMKDRNRFPREVVDAPSLETFKVGLDEALSNLM